MCGELIDGNDIVVACVNVNDDVNEEKMMKKELRMVKKVRKRNVGDDWYMDVYCLLMMTMTIDDCWSKTVLLVIYLLL